MSGGDGEFVYRHNESAAESDFERRLRAMGQQLVGISVAEAMALLQSLVISTIGNNSPPDQAGARHNRFVQQLRDHAGATIVLSHRVALKRALAAGHA